MAAAKIALLSLLSSITTQSFSSIATTNQQQQSPPAPPGHAYLPFQLESIASLVQAPGSILLADEMGLGKTISVIGAINTLVMHNDNNNNNFAKVLIVCPKSVMPSWQYELNTWLVTPRRDDNNDNGWTIHLVTAKDELPAINNKTANANARHVLLMNYDICEKFRPALDNDVATTTRPFDLVVCDEAHYLKNPTAQRTRAILGDHEKNGKHRRPLATQRLWFLTGSPILNNPAELYTLLHAMDQNCQIIPQLYSLEAFGEYYSHAKQTPWGSVVYQGGRNLRELRQRLSQPRGNNGTALLPPLMVRRIKAQVLQDLPPKRHQLLPLYDEENRIASQEFLRVQEALQQLEQRIQKRKPPEAKAAKKRTVAELKVLLKENNLKVSGTKKELVERLQQHWNDTDTTADPTFNNQGTLQALSSSNNPNDATDMNGLYVSAQSALRSHATSSSSGDKSNILGDLLGMLTSKGMHTTKSDKNAVLGVLAAARHETARMKVPHAIDLIQNIIDIHKVVVFAHHRDVQQDLRQAFGAKAVGITGGDSMEDRAEAVRRFQTDSSVRVFVGSIKAAGTGITLNAASHVIFVELDWSPLVVQQAEDRCHRVGQKSSVLVQYLYFPDTIDEYLSDLLAKKQSTITSAIDEATGSASWQFSFGKYEGLSVADVAGTDPGYLEWLVNSKAAVLHTCPVLPKALKELGFLSSDWTESEDFPLDSDSIEDDEEEQYAEVKVDLDEITEGPATWVFDFGKHSGKRVVDVAKQDPGYLQWIVKKRVFERRVNLAMALSSLGFLSEMEAKSAAIDRGGEGTEPTEQSPRTKAGSHVMTFGKHKGKQLQDIPTAYLNWLQSSGTIRKNPILGVNLKKHLSERTQGSPRHSKVVYDDGST